MKRSALDDDMEKFLRREGKRFQRRFVRLEKKLNRALLDVVQET